MTANNSESLIYLLIIYSNGSAEGLKKISLTRIIKKAKNKKLLYAKNLVDSFASGVTESIDFEFDNQRDLIKYYKQLVSCGISRLETIIR